RQAQTAVQGQTDTGLARAPRGRRSSKADTTRRRCSRPGAACWPKFSAIRSAAIRGATGVMQRADMRSKRSGAVSIAHNVSVGLWARTFASFHSTASGQPADLVLCAGPAADPADPEKPKDVKGAHEIEASDVATAIKFCKLASAA